MLQMREDQSLQIQGALRDIVSKCPRIRSQCYWAGTSAIAIEELKHRDSFDLDLHTKEALADVAPLLAELQIAFRSRLSVIEPPSPYGSGFQGSLRLENGDELTLQVMANFEDVPANQLVPSRLVPGIQRVSLAKYLRDKLTCLVERHEARDLIDVKFAIEHSDSLKNLARRSLNSLDEVLLAERLLGWTDQGIASDLKAYPDSDPSHAVQARDLLLSWLGQ